MKEEQNRAREVGRNARGGGANTRGGERIIQSALLPLTYHPPARGVPQRGGKSFVHVYQVATEQYRFQDEVLFAVVLCGARGDEEGGCNYVQRRVRVQIAVC